MINPINVFFYVIITIIVTCFDIYTIILLNENNDIPTAGLFIVIRNIFSILLLYVCLRMILNFETFLKISSKNIKISLDRQLIFGNLSQPVAAMFFGTLLRLISEILPLICILLFAIFSVDNFWNLLASASIIFIPFVLIFWLISAILSQKAIFHLKSFYKSCQILVDNWKDIQYLSERQHQIALKDTELSRKQYINSNSLSLLHANSMRMYIEILAIMILFLTSTEQQSLTIGFVIYRLAATMVNLLGYISNLLHYYPQAKTVFEKFKNDN